MTNFETGKKFETHLDNIAKELDSTSKLVLSLKEKIKKQEKQPLTKRQGMLNRRNEKYVEMIKGMRYNLKNFKIDRFPKINHK